MNEKVIQRRIVRITVLTIVVSLMLLAGSFVLLYSMTTAERSSYEAQMQAFINEYKINIERQFDSDIESLETLAAFISDSQLLEMEHLEDGIDGAGSKALFLRFGYCEKGSDRMRISLSKNMGEDLTLSDQPQQLQDIVYAAWDGAYATSYMYTDTILNERVIAYAVPVYNDNAVVACLVGVKDLGTFEELLNKSTLSQIHMDVDWVNQSGEYITWSDHSIIESHLDSVFSSEYISKQEQEQIRAHMAAGEFYTSGFDYDGQSYPLYFQPLDRNGWYLVCTDRTSAIKSPVYFKFVIVIITFFVIMILSIFSILYGSRFLRRNNRTLIHLAYYDPLTGCYNMPRFRQEIAELLKNDPEYSIAVLNIRHFRYINEIFERSQADRLLCGIADILRSRLTKEERYCRYMADEFYLLLHSTDEAKVKERVLKIMDEAGHIAGAIHKSYPIILYSGIAVNDSSTSSTGNAGSTADTPPDIGEELMHKAEFALKHAHVGQENMAVFYDESIHQADRLQNEIESDMKRALDDGEFKLYMQPKKNLHLGRITSAEALVRWIRADGTMIYPDQFIPVFEKNGFCAHLDMYMVEQVCRQLRQWIDAGYEPITVSINQSKLLFYQSDYVSRLCEITDRYRIPRSYIMLEILEGLAVQSIEEINKNISVLHEKGFKLSLDDFGSGYSSLNLLSDLEIDEVKLDRGFLAKDLSVKNRKQRMLMRSIIHLARDLKISTVVEGVENETNEAFISGIGADYGQGYYYSRPIPGKEFEEKYLKRPVI